MLRVESDDAGFAIAVGRDPNDGVLALRAGAVVAALVGIAIGVALLLAFPTAPCRPAGGRRRLGAPSRAQSPDWPMSPPGFPAPPPTTGTTAVVGPPTGPAIRPGVGSVADAAVRPGSSVAPIPGQPGPWGPPPPPAGQAPGDLIASSSADAQYRRITVTTLP